MMKPIKLFASLIMSTSLLSWSAVYADALSIDSAPNRPKNMVIMIGDGMGPAYTSAYRYYQDNPNTQEIEQTVFDRLFVGKASTYPAAVSGLVTDSAAAATALATGVKSYNGAISVDTNKQPIPTLLELAKRREMSTGVVVTSQINHATPAAFLSHTDKRSQYDDLAESYLKTDADVMLGGGQKYFPDALIKRFEAKGYQYLSDIEQLDTLTQPKVIGLFADVELPWAIDEPDSHSLSKMTQKALELLSQNDKGFVLLVEGSLIDWAGHDNDIATTMAEMHEFANAVEVVEQYVRNHNDTLMVVTADHDTGGMALGANHEYRWEPQILRTIGASPEKIAKDAVAINDWRSLVELRLGWALNEQEYQTLSNARMQGHKRLQTSLKQLIDRRSNTGWTTEGHTGIDVQVFATGPASPLFFGQLDNTDIAKHLISLLPKEQKATAETKAVTQKKVANSALPSVVTLETVTSETGTPEAAIQGTATDGKAQTQILSAPLSKKQ